ncbi:glycerophosphodiester phosphodiesterase [Aeoliella mucimassa]|uniref:Glycerophosphoryl diester phosphodiesterase n=1 Tax=Aeoliella mucimassa TaxID=2527972 RepID=A0A518ALJ3_9BACT|nr:glycerophosphodiester phosphodiesterase [Aeoliella mucimassa]QDU55600.1 Glycerophosphoryl diester phosphodiesterase [Aeoliella mucimassa]
MAPSNAPPTLAHDVVQHIRSSWKSLVFTDIAFKVLAFVVLTPLVSIFFHGMLALGGSSVVSDMDILFFFLGPVGWISLIVIGGLWLAIVALEQAALLGILACDTRPNHLLTTVGLRFAASKAWPLLRVTMRIVVWTLLAVLPFLVVIGAIYMSLLTEYDINFYLKEKPPVFLWAVALAAICLTGMTVLLLRLACNWFLALPLVLFENIAPQQALQVSRERVAGHRRKLLFWIVAWLIATFALGGIASGLVGLLGRAITPDSSASLRLLAFTVGITLLLWTVVNLAVNLLSTISFSSLLYSFYHEFGTNCTDRELQATLEAAVDDKKPSAINHRRIVVGAVLGFAIALGVGIVAIRNISLEDNVKIMAHRGASVSAPENTMAAFRQAIEDGADFIELDVQETADGEVVVVHDSDFMKLAGNRLKIWDANLADLESIDIGSWYDAKFNAERVPTLGEVLDLCKDRIHVNIELKYYGHDQQLEERVAELVEARGMTDQVMAMSLKRDKVEKMKSIRPEWKVGLLMSVSAGSMSKMKADFLAVNARFANRRLIRSAHQNDKEVYVWTVNDAVSMSTMISRGADGLLTDNPALARSVLEQRAEMGAAERLLLELSSILGVQPEIGEQ